MSIETPEVNSEEISFQLVRFKELSFSILPDHRKLEESEEVDIFTNASFRVVDPGSFMTIELAIMAKEQGVEEAPELFRLRTEIVVKFFGIESKVTGGGIALPEQLLLNLVIVAYASSRGLLLARTMGTFCEELPLPFNKVSTLLPVHSESLQSWFG